MKVGLFFGSFNPVHIGHLAIANYFVDYTDIEQLWFVVSPQSPFKVKQSMLPERTRYELIQQAIQGDSRFRVSDIEFNLPQPSYTSSTLAYLREKYEHSFYLIMGEDNLKGFHKWRNYNEILQYHNILVYPRLKNEAVLNRYEQVEIVEAPQIEISSSFIRQSIKEGKKPSFFLHPNTYKYIDEMNFYK